jgi:hypothetical protein
MRLQVVALIYITIILFSIAFAGLESSKGFSTIVTSTEDKDPKSCIESNKCHLSGYTRLTQGEAFPYEHCLCHGELVDQSLVVEIKGPRTAVTDEKLIYTLIMHGGPGIAYGYSVNASNGYLPKRFHFTPRSENTIEIEYVTPSNPQTVKLTFVGLSADGDWKSRPETNSSIYAGDSWNVHRITIDIVERKDVKEPESNNFFSFILIIAIIILLLTIIILSRRGGKK